jgi:signal transduction histidine kinase
MTGIMNPDEAKEKSLRIGIVGGGKRCETILQMFQRQRPPKGVASVVIVAGGDPSGPGYRYAETLGIETTTDLETFCERRDLNFILDLAGERETLIRILVSQNSRVPVLDGIASTLLYDLLNIQKELINTRRFLNTVLDSIQEGILVISPEYEILRVNAPLLKKLKRPEEDVIGKSCHEILYGEDTPCIPPVGICPVAEVMKSGRPQHTRHRHLDIEGNSIHHAVSAYPVMEDGKVSRIVEISRDVTHDTRTQEMLLQQEKLSSVGKLAAGVAHEINNPLTAVLTNSMLLLEDLAETHPMYEDLQGIADETLRCRDIVRGLLEFARQEAPSKAESDLNRIVGSVIGLVQKQFSFKNISIEQNLDPDLPLVRLDRDQIQQVVVNILINAMEAIQRDGKIWIDTAYDREKRIIELKISDSGHGIPEDVRLKLFDPFFTTKEGGTGLGLSISHGIIERHGGSISCESQGDNGTTFTIELPAAEGQW